MDALLTSNRFETEIARYHQWRDGLTQAVNGYKEWLEANNELDIQQSIRFFDLVENLNKGRPCFPYASQSGLREAERHRTPALSTP